MAVGDGMVFLEGFNHFQFTGTAQIVEVRETEFVKDDEGGRKYVVKIALKDMTPFSDPLALDVMWYSLTIVRNLERPWLHFRRGYRLLPAVDFESIKRGERFVARSGYYELLNALPPSLRAAYQAEEILAANGRRTRASFRQLLERLHTFIDERVLAVGRLLRDIGGLASKLRLGHEALEHTFTSEPNEVRRPDGRPDELGIQLFRFAKLQEALRTEPKEGGGPDDQDAVVAAIRELESPERQRAELRFERIFASTL
jgi:hypothetical protein